MAARPGPEDDDEPLPEDVEDEDDDDVEYTPRKRARRGPNGVSIALAVVAAVGLGVTAYAPSEAWITLSGGPSPKSSPDRVPDVAIVTDGFGNRWITEDGRKLTSVEMFGVRQAVPEFPPLAAAAAPRGTWVMALAIVGAVVVLFGSLAAVRAGPSGAWSRPLAVWVPGLGLTVAVVLLVWLVGWLFKVVMLSRLLNSEQAGLQAQPGLGLYLGLGGVLAGSVAASGLSRWGLKGSWLYAFQAAGLVIGAVLLVALIRPWDAGDLWAAMLRG